MSKQSFDRYARQIAREQVGQAGQERLAASRILVVGCGALGTTQAETMARAGVGHIRIADRDFVERNNLQRQVLFDEEDVRNGRSKAAAAADKLGRINADVTVEPHVLDVNHTNIERLADDTDLILDGTDNFETRYLINDYAVCRNVPWLYGAAVATTGLCMPVIPGETPCLRCLFEEAPPPDMNPTCDTAGVLAMTVSIVANLQCVEAMKILLGKSEDLNRKLTHVDSWTPRIVSLRVERPSPPAACPCCQHNDYPFLRGERASQSATLCGRDAVQILPPSVMKLDLGQIAGKIRETAGDSLRVNAYLLQAELEGLRLSLFHDGRAIVQGTEEPERARSLVSRFVGN